MQHNQANLDHNATGTVHPQALQAFLDAARHPARPDALHPAGQQARQMLNHAYKHVATYLGTEPANIVLTTSGTEADALALTSAMVASSTEPTPHVICSGIEHAAISASLAYFEKLGWLTYSTVPARRHGQIALEDIDKALRAQTRLVCITYACNETGALQPIADVVAMCHQRNVRVHTDAVQAIGKVAIDVTQLGVDSLSFSGHKLGAVPGIAGLYVRPGNPIFPLQGSYPDPSPAAALSLATALAHQPGPMHWQHVAQQRDAFEAFAQQHLGPDVEILAQQGPRLPNTTALRIPGCSAEGLMMALDIDGFAVSTGSACSSGSLEASKLLLGMGLSPQEALETLRISLGAPLDEALWHSLKQSLQRAVQMSVSVKSP